MNNTVEEQSLVGHMPGPLEAYADGEKFGVRTADETHSVLAKEIPVKADACLFALAPQLLRQRDEARQQVMVAESVQHAEKQLLLVEIAKNARLSTEMDFLRFVVERSRRDVALVDYLAGWWTPQGRGHHLMGRWVENTAAGNFRDAVMTRMASDLKVPSGTLDLRLPSSVPSTLPDYAGQYLVVLHQRFIYVGTIVIEQGRLHIANAKCPSRQLTDDELLTYLKQDASASATMLETVGEVNAPVSAVTRLVPL